MSKIARKNHVLFGLTGTTDNFVQFGSTVGAGSLTTKDPEVIEALDAWKAGWQAEVYASNKAPFLEEMNAFSYAHSYQTAYLLQEGVAEWNADTVYYIGSIAKRAGTSELYASLTDDNSGNALPVQASNAQWEWINAPDTPVGTIIDSAAILTPTGFYPCDGAEKSRIDDARLFAAISLTLVGDVASGSKIIQNIPSTANLEVGWPLSGLGVATGAVIESIDSGTQIHMSIVGTSTHPATPLVYAPFGVGDGDTTFNVPNSKGRGTIDSGQGAGLTNRVLGVKLGEETHQLTVAEMPAHTHLQQYQPGGGGFVSGASIAGGTQATGSTGGDGAHNNMQPSLVTRKYIKY